MTNQESNIGDLQDLFSNAADQGLSVVTTGLLVNNLNTLTIAGAQGTSVDDLSGDEATLFVRVIDRTGSMRRFQGVVIDAANEQINALKGSKAGDSILMSTWLFNESPTLLHSYVPLDNVIAFDQNNYDTDGATALYDAVLDAITSCVAYTQSLRDSGIRVKVVIVIVTDGEDNCSRNSVTKVKSVIDDLLKQEIYTVAFVAFGTNGKNIADKMGIPPANVLDESADSHAIRLAMNTVSKSVIRASQTVIGAQNSQSFFS